MRIHARLDGRLRALLLILTAIFLAGQFEHGALFLLIGPRFGWFVFASVMLLIMMAGGYTLVQRGQADQTAGDVRVSAWPLVLMALPLILGALVHVHPLEADDIDGNELNTGAAFSAEGAARSLTITSSERTVWDWAQIIHAGADPSTLNGQAADVTGFVYHDPALADDQFYVTRFTMVCCAADVSAVGVVVAWDEAADISQGLWVRVEGVYVVDGVNGEEVPVLHAQTVTPVEEPEPPYLYP